MTIYTDMPVRRGPFYLEDYTASLGLTNEARAEGAFVTNPTPSLLRSGELTAAEQGPLNLPTQLGLSALGAINPVAKAYQAAQGPGLPSFFRSAPNSPVVDATTARQRIKDEGLDLTVPDTGIRSRALDILIERKKAERQRNDILSRAPGGFVAGAARLGTNLAVSAMDPLNIASAFIPVVGEARYTAMLAKAGGPMMRAGVRATVGAAEGAVGAAVVEPVVSLAAHQEQADYDLTDSIANIAFGTALGGGLHVGAGVISDAVRAGRDWRTARASPDAPIPRMMESVAPGTREAALRAGVSQAVTGREINVEPVVSYASRQGFEEPLRASVGPAEAPRIDEVTGVEGFTVFHGSPHTFDRFSMEHIGKGEGAQAYGHGLYFAESKGVAKSYEERLGRQARALDEMPPEAEAKYGAALDTLASRRDAATVPAEKQAIEEEMDALQSKIDREFGLGGATYEVRIRANPEDFLDWDKPLSEQPKVVQNLAASQPANVSGNTTRGGQLASPNGEDIVRRLGGMKEATDKLRQAGIPGIKYLDQGSRVDPAELKTWQGAVALYELSDEPAIRKKLAVARKHLADLERRQAEGSRNFVVFDDSLLHTVRRNDEFIAKQPQDLRATAQASFNPEQMRLYDGEAVRMADERIAAAPKDEDMPDVSLKEAMEDVTRLANDLGDPEIVTRELADVNELSETAAAYGRGIIAAAECRTRRA